MSTQPTARSTSPKTHQYDDWVCLMCQNLNYSFRKTCNFIFYSGNRCRIQTKANNDYLIQFYQASAYLTFICQDQTAESSDPNPQMEPCTYGQHEFPKCLFLELNRDEEDETSVLRRQVPQLQTPRWINCLIGE